MKRESIMCRKGVLKKFWLNKEKFLYLQRIWLNRSFINDGCRILQVSASKKQLIVRKKIKLT